MCEENLVDDTLVTILGSAYFEPISVLLEKLEQNNTSNSNEVQANNVVNGYASSVCLLAVTCLESYVMRVRYVNKAIQKDINCTPVSIYLKKLYPEFPFEKELIEIHVLRDVIAHNHLWEVSFAWDDEKGMVFQAGGVNKKSEGDKKYKQYVDTQNNVTRNLGLNINPIKVDASDVEKVLRVTWDVLLFLESKNRSQCYVSHLFVKYKDKRMNFGDVIALLKTCA